MGVERKKAEENGKEREKKNKEKEGEYMMKSWMYEILFGREMSSKVKNIATTTNLSPKPVLGLSATLGSNRVVGHETWPFSSSTTGQQPLIAIIMLVLYILCILSSCH